MLLVWRLAVHNLDHRASEPFGFDVAGDHLAGTLWLPDAPAKAAVILVHGDGPQDRSAGGGYALLINTLLDAGIAIASWEKAGIGMSSGNWLDQSVSDRAAEAKETLRTLSGRLDGTAVGALGFSQEGWVLPQLSSDDADFIVLVGPAVSWQQQGEYYARMRLQGGRSRCRQHPA